MPEKESSFATGGPAGLMVMAFYLAVLCPVITGIAPPGMAILLVPFGIAGVLVQLIAGVIDLKRGDIVGGNITLAFSAFMVFGACSTLLKFLKIGPADTALVDGFVFLVMGVILILLTGPSMRSCLSFGLFMIITDVFFLLLGIGNIFAIQGLVITGGYCLIGSIITLIWTACGITLNTAYGRETLSLGTPLIKPEQSSVNV